MEEERDFNLDFDPDFDFDFDLDFDLDFDFDLDLGVNLDFDFDLDFDLDDLDSPSENFELDLPCHDGGWVGVSPPDDESLLCDGG